MNNRFVGFQVLKQSVPLLAVLDRYGLIDRLQRSGHVLNGPCPIHGGHNPTQFRADLNRNLWCCFGDCQGGGSIIDFVSRMERIGVRDAGLQIQAWFTGPGDITRVVDPPPVTPRPTVNPPLRYEISRLDAEHPYLKERGLARETVQIFGVGYCNTGPMQGRIALPIHNAYGRLVAYAGRWPGTPPAKRPRYRMPRGFRKSLELFNAHRSFAGSADGPLIVVEGFFGCMHVWQAGFYRVVALMGSRLSDAQAARLSAISGEVVLMLDADVAGHEGTEVAVQRIRHHVPVRVVDVGRFGRQPDELSREQLQTLLRV